MFTYICLGTNNLERSVKFYDGVLGALGIKRCDIPASDVEVGWVGWGTYDSGDVNELALWICEPFNGNLATAGNGTMIAFSAKTRQEVRNFYENAINFGGTSEGEPGLRPQYGPNFFVAYIRDPDGNKLAAVCRGKE